MTATVSPQVGQQDVLIYFLASPKDADVCQAIHRHLTPIIRNSTVPIRVFDDFDVPAGTDTEEHRRQLMDADIVLSLISADFINDDDVYNRNQSVIERYNRGETLMISILVRNCLWKASPLAQFPLLPKNLQPLNNKQFWNSEDDAMTAVVADLYESIGGILNEMSNTTVLPSAPVAAPAPAPVSPREPVVNVSLTDESTAGTGDLVGAATAPALAGGDPPGALAEAPSMEADADAATGASVAGTDVDRDVDVVIELPASEPVTEAVADAPPVTTKPVTPTFVIARPAVTTPIQTDWRKGYYRWVIAKRAAAILLDYAILLLVPAFMYGIVAGFLETSDSAFDLGLDIIFWVGLAAFYLLAPALEASGWRATPGKRILNLQITDEHADRISYWRAFGRNVLRTFTLYSYVFVLPLVYQFFRFRKTKQLFHDEITSTVIGERLAT